MKAFVPAGLDSQSPDYIASLIASLGFNCVRLNWSVQLVLENPIVLDSAVSATGRTDIPALEVLDMVVDALTRHRVMTILDNHMSDAGWCCDVRDGNGLWFSDNFSVADWEGAWSIMATRYIDNLYVIGADIRNEIRPDFRIKGKLSPNVLPYVEINMPTWGGGDRNITVAEYAPDILEYDHPALDTPRMRFFMNNFKKVLRNAPVRLYDWHSAAEKTANLINKANDRLLVFVQGTFDKFSYVPNALPVLLYYIMKDPALFNTIGRFLQIPMEATRVYQVQNLTGIASLPIQLRGSPDKLVYSSHLYPFVYDSAQYRWDGVDPSFEEYAESIDKFWGYIYQQDIAPVWVGEIGYQTDPRLLNSSWTDYTLRYMKERDLDFAYWPLGDAKPTVDRLGRFKHGADEFGLLNSGFSGVKYNETYQLLLPILKDENEYIMIQN